MSRVGDWFPVLHMLELHHYEISAWSQYKSFPHTTARCRNKASGSHSFWMTIANLQTCKVGGAYVLRDEGSDVVPLRFVGVSHNKWAKGFTQRKKCCICNKEPRYIFYLHCNVKMFFLTHQHTHTFTQSIVPKDDTKSPNFCTIYSTKITWNIDKLRLFKLWLCSQLQTQWETKFLELGLWMLLVDPIKKLLFHFP